MYTPRPDPYVWVTWVTKLLAGESHCEWATWFRAHHTYDKLPSDFDSVRWRADHTEFVRETAESLRLEGYHLTIEDQNHFHLKGNAATLGGKPDIVAVKGEYALVVDCKTGSMKDSDYQQILIYMLVLPLVNPQCVGKTVAGELRYRGYTYSVPPTDLTPLRRQLIRSAIERAGSSVAPSTVPSFHECRFCDIPSTICPERVDQSPLLIEVDHDLF